VKSAAPEASIAWRAPRFLSASDEPTLLMQSNASVRRDSPEWSPSALVLRPAETETLTQGDNSSAQAGFVPCLCYDVSKVLPFYLAPSRSENQLPAQAADGIDPGMMRTRKAPCSAFAPSAGNHSGIEKIPSKSNGKTITEQWSASSPEQPVRWRKSQSLEQSRRSKPEFQ